MLQDGSVQPLSPALRQKAMQAINHMAEKALRCLAFAQKTDLGELNSKQRGMQGIRLLLQLQVELSVPSKICTSWQMTACL